jgi:hypothetical protein
MPHFLFILFCIYTTDLVVAGLNVSTEETTENTIEFVFGSVNAFNNFSKENQLMFSQYLLDIVKTATDLLPTTSSASMKNAYKKVMFMFQHFCIKCEADFKSAGSAVSASSSAGAAAGKTSKKAAAAARDESFQWSEYRFYALEALEKLMSSPLSTAWSMGLVHENFLFPAWSYALKLLIDRPVGIAGTAHKEVSARARCVRVFAAAVAHFGSATSCSSYSTVATALLEAIVAVEHIATSSAAELCHHIRLVGPAQGSQIVNEILGEISRMNFANMPATGIKNVGSFLESFAKIAPASVCDAFPILMKLIDNPAHQIRSANLQGCGYIVSYVHECVTAAQGKNADAATTTTSPAAVASISTEGHAAAAPREENGEDDSSSSGERNIGSLLRTRDLVLDILTERTHDISPYTRATVLKIWGRMLETGSLPVKLAGRAAEIAVDRLQDKNASVRRNAVALMTTVIENNPFSGTLDAGLYRLQQMEVQRVLQERIAELKKQYLPEAAEGAAAAGATPGAAGGKRRNKQHKKTELDNIAEEEEEDDDDDDDDQNEDSAGDVDEQTAEDKEKAAGMFSDCCRLRGIELLCLCFFIFFIVEVRFSFVPIELFILFSVCFLACLCCWTR